jgi:hypothetical protein
MSSDVIDSLGEATIKNPSPTLTQQCGIASEQQLAERSPKNVEKAVLSTPGTAATVSKMEKAEEVPLALRKPIKLPTDLISARELELLVQKEGPEEYVVGGLVRKGSVNIAIGDSGLGKSPLFYQMAVCVAAGIPFLGYKTQKGSVIYFDYENGLRQSDGICGTLTGFLGLAERPPQFYIWSFGYHVTTGLEKCFTKYRPNLCIIDSLRGFSPDAEKENSIAARALQSLRSIARKYDTAFVIIHHTKKPGLDGSPSLQDTPIMGWLLEASGARSLINQTDARLAIDSANSKRLGATSAANKTKEQIALVLKGHERVRGEFGPVFIAREYDENGEPQGYKRMLGCELLFNEDQEKTFGDLPTEFRFKEARYAYGRQDQATSKFLKKCIDLQLIRKLGHGQYIKCQGGEVGE